MMQGGNRTTWFSKCFMGAVLAVLVGLVLLFVYFAATRETKPSGGPSDKTPPRITQ